MRTLFLLSLQFCLSIFAAEPGCLFGPADELRVYDTPAGSGSSGCSPWSSGFNTPRGVISKCNVGRSYSFASSCSRLKLRKLAGKANNRGCQSMPSSPRHVSSDNKTYESASNSECSETSSTHSFSLINTVDKDTFNDVLCTRLATIGEASEEGTFEESMNYEKCEEYSREFIDGLGSAYKKILCTARLAISAKDSLFTLSTARRCLEGDIEFILTGPFAQREIFLGCWLSIAGQKYPKKKIKEALEKPPTPRCFDNLLGSYKREEFE